MDNDTLLELIADGDRLAGLDLIDLLVEVDEELTEDERVEAELQVGQLAGCLWNASILLIDQLFEDLQTYDVTGEPTEQQMQGTLLLHTLPKRFVPHYTKVFARQYLVAAVDLTSRLSQGWKPPACVAEELVLRQLLGLTEVMVEVNAADVPFEWRDELEDVLFEDLEHELLFDLTADVTDEDDTTDPVAEAVAILPTTPLHVDQWFVPFDDAVRLPPYCEDEPA